MGYSLIAQSGVSKADLAAVTPQQPGEVILGGANGPTTSRFGVFDPRGGRAPLRRFHAALANVATAPVDILCLGDSITEGGNATTPANRWVEKLRDALRARYQPAGVTGGVGYRPSYYNVASVADAFTLTGSPGVQNNYGLGRRNLALTSGQTASITATATRFDLFYAQGSGAGTFSYQVDGGAAVNVNSNNPTNRGSIVTSITGLTSASHTLTVTGPATLSAFVEGVMVYNGDESAGIRLWESGHSGYMASDYMLANNFHWRDILIFGVLKPALVTVCFGANEWGNGVSPATFQANLQALVAQLRSDIAPDPSIVLVIPQQREDTTINTAPYPWSQYVDAIYAVAMADGNVGLCDIGARIGLGSWDSNSGLSIVDSDKIHCSPIIGGQFWANALARYLEP